MNKEEKRSHSAKGPFLPLLAALMGCVFLLTGCHGSKGLDAFAIRSEEHTSELQSP